MSDARQAIEEAEVVAVTAASNQAVLETAWLRPGALVTNIAGRALPRDIYEHTRLVVPALLGPAARPSGWDPFPLSLNGGRDASTIAATLVDVMRNPDLRVTAHQIAQK